MLNEVWFWEFNGAILLLLLLDLFVFHKKGKVYPKEALIMSFFWVSLALLFNLYIYKTEGGESALNFFTCYLLEKSLSVDNLFVFLLLFSYFKVPEKLLHTVLFWGVLGAILMRAIFILFGIALIENFHQIFYVFGLFLFITGIKLAFQKKEEVHPEKNLVVLFFERFLPITKDFREEKFFVKERGKIFATPLFLTLIAVETTDLVFAIDSIPAIIGITTDPFILYTSNIFAVLGLRSLYFVLNHSFALFHYLHYGLAFILSFIGLKMLVAGYVTIPVVYSLALIAAVFGLSIGLSLLYPKPQ